jgi:hypothetical protein
MNLILFTIFSEANSTEQTTSPFSTSRAGKYFEKQKRVKLEHFNLEIIGKRFQNFLNLLFIGVKAKSFFFVFK